MTSQSQSTSVAAAFNFQSHEIRTIVRNSSIWFVAVDVCNALGYSNTSKAIADHLDDDEKANESLGLSGSPALIINESGLYALVLRSRKPEARKFAKWVTSEVLPTIRKTGSYHTKPPVITRRELVVTDEDGTRIIDATDKCLVPATRIRQLQRDMSIMQAAMREMSRRMSVCFGEVNAEDLNTSLPVPLSPKVRK